PSSASSSAAGAPAACEHRPCVARDTSPAGLASSSHSWMLARPTVVCDDHRTARCAGAGRRGQEEAPMQARTVLRGLVITTVLAVLAALLPQMASAGPKGASARYLVVARSSAAYGALRAKAGGGGARVLLDLPQARTLVVNAPASARSSLAADRRTVGVARDQVRRLSPERNQPHLSAPRLHGATQPKAKAPAAPT